MPVLIFANKDERIEFEGWVSKNNKLRECIENELSENAIIQHICAKEKQMGKPQCGVLQVAIAFAFYQHWKKDK